MEQQSAFFQSGGERERVQRKGVAEGNNFFTPTGIQPKLTIGAANDPYESEADAVASKVVDHIQGGEQAESVSGSGADIQTKPLPEARRIQRKPIFESEGTPEVQAKLMPNIQRSDTGDASTPSDNFSSQLASSKGGGQPLPEETQSSMGSAFGSDFSGVNVHTGSDAAQMNNDIGARAFTHGSDIYFNEGQYDTESSDGQELLAHELTHTVQQGGGDDVQRKEEPAIAPKAPQSALDIAHRFLPNKAWAAYLDSRKKNKPTAVKVKIGSHYTGVIEVVRIDEPTETEPGKYELYKAGKKQSLEASGLSSLNFLRDAKLTPVLVLNKFGKDRQTTGFMSVVFKGKTMGNTKAMLESFNSNMKELGFLGLDRFALKGIQIENTFENGRLLFSVGGLKTNIDGFIEGTAGIGIAGDQLTLDVNANVDVRGVASGEFNLKRLSSGVLEGRAELSANVANVESVLVVEYLDGVVTIQGTGTINSEKFQGSVSFIVTDQERADETMRTELGVVQVEEEKQQPKTTKEKAKSKKNQVLVGWGTIQATITPWLEGTAMIGIDSKGQITIVGKITVPQEVELMKEQGVKKTLFEVDIKAGYGVPFVGQAYLFAGVELFINSGFGPLVLRGVEFDGKYSTDPSILQSFAITGELAINAFAILGLVAKAGVGITLLGHDVEAGIAVTAAAGVRAYATAQPLLQYVEKPTPEGGKVGEARLKGHFEAAAQLFLMLAGEFYVELDSPWWSPAPDKKWPYPLGSVEYPLGEMGIGGDVDWLVGSPEIPQLTFSPVAFNPEKFTKDIMADPPPGKGKGGEKKGDGKWEDQSAQGEPKGDGEKDAKGLEGKKKIDYTKLPEQERFMKGLGEVGELGERAKKSPITISVLNAKLKKVKAKYALQQVRIESQKDGEASVGVKQGKHNNKDNRLKVRLMTEEARLLLLKKAGEDFQKSLKAAAGENHKLTRSEAAKVGVAIQKRHSIVIENIGIVDAGTRWDFAVDMGDIVKKWPGKEKGEVQEVKQDPNSKANDSLDPEEKKRRLEEGLKAIDQEEQKYLKNGTIAKEDAEQLVIAIKVRFPVFTSLKVVDGGDSWDYVYTASDPQKKEGEKKGVDGEPPKQAILDPGYRNGKKAFGFHAEKLFTDGKKANHKPGTAASTYKGDLFGALDTLRSIGMRSKWVAFHIVNDNYSGKAVESNLIPTPGYVNKDFHNEFERALKDYYNASRPIWMTAVVEYRKDIKMFPISFEAKGGPMKFDGTDWVEDRERDLPKFFRKIDPPVSETVYINEVTQNEEEWILIYDLSPLEKNLLRIITQYSNGDLESKDGIRNLIEKYGKTATMKSRMLNQVERANINFGTEQ